MDMKYFTQIKIDEERKNIYLINAFHIYFDKGIDLHEIDRNFTTNNGLRRSVC